MGTPFANAWITRDTHGVFVHHTGVPSDQTEPTSSRNSGSFLRLNSAPSVPTITRASASKWCANFSPHVAPDRQKGARRQNCEAPNGPFQLLAPRPYFPLCDLARNALFEGPGGSLMAVLLTPARPLRPSPRCVSGVSQADSPRIVGHWPRGVNRFDGPLPQLSLRQVWVSGILLRTERGQSVGTGVNGCDFLENTDP